MGWQAIQHGADAILYWQWRSARNGQETYYGTVLGQDGEPNPIFGEIAKLGGELQATSAALGGTEPVAKLAFIYSYDSRWAIDLQRHHKDFDPIKAFTDFYRPIRVQSQGVHVISPDADLSRYRLVVAPNMMVMTETEAAALEAYVRGGGHLVLGPRSGMRDDANALYPRTQPGPLADLLGAHVAQYYALDEGVALTGAIAGKASIWAEELTPTAPDVRTIATYRDPGGWLDGKAAIVTRKVGSGSITYVGAWLDPATMSTLAAGLLAEAKVTPVIAGAHPDFEIAEREGKGKHILIAINHGKEAHPLALPAGAKPAGGDWADGRVAAHGVAWFTLPGGAR
jgi:beta-galactosidase